MFLLSIMVRPEYISAWISCFTMASAMLAGAIGVNWGSLMSHRLPPSTVVRMLKDNGINKVKLFDADGSTVNAFARTGIDLMLGIPNDQLSHLARDYNNAQRWVTHNVTKYLHIGGFDIKYIAVGNEPFLESFNGAFIDVTLPALKNIHRALVEAGISHHMKPTVPLNADVYDSPADSPIPSSGNFRADIRKHMVQLVHFLHAINAPFIINIYPFLSLYQNPNFPMDFAFFEGRGKPLDDAGVIYTNVLDANHDTLIWSLKKAGVPDMKVIVGEIGWPTDGDKNANVKQAKRFYDGLLTKLARGKGTPMRPGRMEVYLFALIDEDLKSVLPGNFERHWGIFTYDGRPKFQMDISTGRGRDKYLVGAKGVEYLAEQWCVLNDEAAGGIFERIPASVNYACSNADCTSLGYGCSCGGLDQKGNVSYAFNAYFQAQDQDERACDFQGLAKIEKKNASQNGCLFPVQILSSRAIRTVTGVELCPLLKIFVALILLHNYFFTC